MRHSRKNERIRLLTKRIAAAQVELALCVEELLNATVTGSNVWSIHSHPADASKRPVADRATFSVKWLGKTCYLGYSVKFRLFERLARRPDQYVSYAELIQDVWRGDCRSDEAIRSEIRLLKAKLSNAGMRPLAAAIRGHHRHYVLNVHTLQ